MPARAPGRERNDGRPVPARPPRQPMTTDPLVTLTTDFGEGSPYVAAMKGVLLGLNPRARLVDLSHRIPPQDLRYAAFFLRTHIAIPGTLTLLPPGSVRFTFWNIVTVVAVQIFVLWFLTRAIVLARADCPLTATAARLSALPDDIIALST